MNLAQKIISNRLTPEGGVFRKLSLFTLSCAAYGYVVKTRKITGISYVHVGALGSKKGWHTLFPIESIVRRISLKLRQDPRWVSRTRLLAKKSCKDFGDKMQKLVPFIDADPGRFLDFVAREYPKYMAGLGVYNFYWRYLEFVHDDMPPFPIENLHQLGVERDEVAKIYSLCELLIKKAIKKLSKTLSFDPGYLLMLTRSEFFRVLRTSRFTITPLMFQQRKHGYVFLLNNNGEAVSTRQKDREQLREYVNIQYRRPSQQELIGRPVQSGRVTGTVIRTLKRRRWPKKAIYIAQNTHPTEVPYLKQVVGIVTNEGGLLCHAAIVARELNIPCVIGTKIATKVFKDGDRVEVNATSGIVRKIIKN